jgi:hypothetical protein
MVGVKVCEAGQVMVGAALSRMDSGKVQDAVLSALSVAVHVTEVVVSTVKRLVPESGHTKLLIPEASVALIRDGAKKVTRTSGRRSVLVVV